MSGIYEIHVRHQIGAEMAHLLEDLEPEVSDDVTVLRTSDLDQPTLHGAIARLADLGLEIVSVERIERAE